MTPYLGAIKTLEFALKDLDIKFIREFQFDLNRKWRADFFINPNLLIEVEGGIWSFGRHTRGQGFLNDLEKYNRSVELGFCLLRYCTQDVLELKCLPQIRRVLENLTLQTAVEPLAKTASPKTKPLIPLAKGRNIL